MPADRSSPQTTSASGPPDTTVKTTPSSGSIDGGYSMRSGGPYATFPALAEWPAEDDEAVVDEGVHERCVLVPPALASFSEGPRVARALVLQVDAEPAQLDDRRSAPADRVGRERQHERHPVRFAKRLAVAQDAVVPRRRLDREAHGFEPANEFTHVLTHPFSWRVSVDGIKRKTACLASSAATGSSDEIGVASK